MCDQIDSLEEVKIKSTETLPGHLIVSLQNRPGTYINKNNSRKQQQKKEHAKNTICIGFRQPYMIKKTSKAKLSNKSCNFARQNRKQKWKQKKRVLKNTVSKA